ncbi:Unknown protein sequence [Pseudomonas amygdali pv. lachrymans]|nr:Unknown protein sequence [Pseudomonas amygdali pv. lachrymans]
MLDTILSLVLSFMTNSASGLPSGPAEGCIARLIDVLLRVI